MLLRLIKIVLVLALGVEVLGFGIHNTINWSTGLQDVSVVLGLTENKHYSVSIVPAISSGTLLTIAYATIITAESIAGLIALWGALQLLQARNADAATFHKAKYFGLVGALMAVAIWFGAFMAIGGSWFQMWQHPLGDGSFNGAFVLTMSAAMIFFIVKDQSFE